MLRVFLTIGSFQALAIALTFVRWKFVAVTLGPEGVGLVSVIDQVVQSAAFFSALSLPFAALKFLSRAHSESEESFQRIYASLLKALLILSTGGILIAIAITLFADGLLGVEVSKHRGLLALAVLGIPAAVLADYFENVLAAAQRFRASSLLTIITNAVFLIGISVGIVFGGVNGLYVGLLTAGAIMTFGTLVYLRRDLGLSIFNQAASLFKELKTSPEIVSFSLMMFVATFTYSLSFLVARYSVINSFGEAQAGLFQAAISVAIGMGLVMNPINTLYLTPMVSRRISKATRFNEATEFQRKLMVILCLGALPAALFPKLLLTIMFSSRFSMASNLVYAFLLWQILVQLTAVNKALLIGFDDVKVYMLIFCLGFAVLVFLSWLLIPRKAVEGVAIAFIISRTIIFLLTLARLRLRHGFSFPAKPLGLVAYGVAVIFLAHFLANNYEEWEPTVVGLKLILYSIFSLSLLFFLSGEEKGTLLGFRDRILMRALNR